ncbi:MAG TPA: GAF domain-containing protein [Anaerolineae bacterium]|nr:GAF domain-containing protein [Anaerolineae bacterium]
MPTSTFWIDLAAYSLTTLVAAALLLVVLGMGVRRPLNLSFSLLMAGVALWAAASVILRIALWFDTGTQQFWMELSTLAFMVVAPLLLIFSGIYVQAERSWPYWVSIGSLLLIGAFCVPLFRHQVIANVLLDAGGVVTWNRSPFLSWVASAPLLVSAVLALALMWRERRRLQEPYLLIAFTILVVFGTVFSIVTLPFPTLSLVMIVVISIMGYGVLNRQLFNPLRELTDRLEDQVAKRTRELEETTDELRQAFQRIQQHTAHLQAAAEVARSVSAIRDVDQLLQDTVRLISDRFGFYHVGIFLLDDPGEYVALRAASSEGGQRMLAQGYRLKVGEGIVGDVVGSGEMRVVPDVGEEAAYLDNPDLPQTRAAIALPLKVRGQLIGVLDVRSTEAGAFAEEEVAALRTLADQLAVGLENARLFAQSQSSLDEMSRLYQVMAGEAWRRFAEGRPDLRRYQVGAAEIPEETWSSLFAQARAQGRPAGLRYRGAGGGRHMLAVPIKLRGVSIGVLGFHRPLEAGEWQPGEISLAEGVAERMALALENVRLLEEARQRAARERLVGEIAGRVRASLDPDVILRTTVQELGRVLGARLVAVEVTGPEGDGGGPLSGEGLEPGGEE